MASFTSTITFPPLQDGYKQSYSLKTNVFTSFNGKETRQKVQDKVFRLVDFQVMLYKKDDLDFMDGIIYESDMSNNIVGVPLWFSKTTLSADASTGSKDLTITDATLDGFTNSDSLLINPLGDQHGSQVSSITAVSAPTVTINDFPSMPFKSGVVVVPVLDMLIGSVVKSKGKRAEAFIYQFSCKEVD